MVMQRHRQTLDIAFHSIIGTCLALLFVASFVALLSFCCGRLQTVGLLFCLSCCGQLRNVNVCSHCFVAPPTLPPAAGFFCQVCGDGGEERCRERDPFRAGSCHRSAVRFRSETLPSEFVRDYNYYCLLCCVLHGGRCDDAITRTSIYTAVFVGAACAAVLICSG